MYIKFARLSLAWLPDKMDWVRGQDGGSVIASLALAKDTVDVVYQIPDALMKSHGLIHQTRWIGCQGEMMEWFSQSADYCIRPGVPEVL